MNVIVTAYNPNWPALYEQEAQAIRQILGKELIAIHHIGSTSVLGLFAKPIIDIMPVVAHIEAVDPLSAQFEALGYEVMGEFGIPGRRYFRKGGDNRTHQIHIFEQSNQYDIIRHLAVRDFLRCHPQDAKAYGELKQQLALRFPQDIESYCDGKDAFVKDLEHRAVLWYPSVPKTGGAFSNFFALSSPFEADIISLQIVIFVKYKTQKGSYDDASGRETERKTNEGAFAGAVRGAENLHRPQTQGDGGTDCRERRPPVRADSGKEQTLVLFFLLWS